MALSSVLKKLFNDFADSQPALRIPGNPLGTSNPKLGDLLDEALAESASEAAYAPTTPADWSPAPTTVAGALDQTGSRLTTAETDITAAQGDATQALSDAAAAQADATQALADAATAQSAANAAQTSADARVRVQRITVGFGDLNTAGSGVAVLFGTAIPDNAVIKKVYAEVTQAFSGDGDSGSLLKLGIEDQDNDTFASAALSSYGAGFQDGVQDGAAANMFKLTAARQLAATWTAGGTDTVLDAGSMDVFVEWVPGT